MPRPARTAIHQHFTPLAKGAEKVPRVHCNHCPWQGKRDVTRQEKHLRICRGNLTFAQDLLRASTNAPGHVNGHPVEGSSLQQGYPDVSPQAGQMGGEREGDNVTDPRLVDQGMDVEGRDQDADLTAEAESLMRLGMAVQNGPLHPQQQQPQVQGQSNSSSNLQPDVKTSINPFENRYPSSSSHAHSPHPAPTAPMTAHAQMQQQQSQLQPHHRIMNPQEKRRIDILYARAIVAEGGTFDLFDRIGHPHMHAFLKALCPDYEPPTRAELGGLVVEEFFQ